MNILPAVQLVFPRTTALFSLRRTKSRLDSQPSVDVSIQSVSVQNEVLSKALFWSMEAVLDLLSIDQDSVELLWSVNADNQCQFNISRSAWTGDKSNRAFHPGRLEIGSKQFKEFVESANDLLGPDQSYVNRRQERDRSRLPGPRNQNQTAGFGERVINSGDTDIRTRGVCYDVALTRLSDECNALRCKAIRDAELVGYSPVGTDDHPRALGFGNLFDVSANRFCVCCVMKAASNSNNLRLELFG